jgi:diguanylate cyclase (GGDEF)-like protein/PAS domain S-box-containing protein
VRVAHDLTGFLRYLNGDWRRHGAVALLPGLVLLVGLSVTAAVCEQTRVFGVQRHRSLESTLRDSVVDAIRSKLDTDIAILSGVAGFFNGSDEVNRREFNTYYESVALNTGQLKGVQGVGFSRWIAPADLQAYEQRIRAQGFPNFRVRPSGVRAHYSSIEFLEPFDWRNQRAFGFDMYSEPVRRRAMERARITGSASLSGKVRLVQETEEDLQRGVLIYVPIYSDRGDASGSSNRQLIGWAYSPLRMNDVVNSAVAGIDNPDLAGTGVLVFDGDRPFASQILYDNLKLFSAGQLLHPAYESLTIAGRTWLVGVQLSPRLVSRNGIDAAFWINLLLGVSASIIGALMARILVTNHLATREALAISEAAMEERAIASTVFEESGQGIIVSNPDGRILMANSAFCRLTGYRISEVKGQGTKLLRSGKQSVEFYQSLWLQLTQRGYWEGDIWNKISNGELRCHHLSISTVRDQTLRPIFYVGMYADVTERHAAEQDMRFMAHHDPLTGLANRAMLMEQLEQHLALARRHKHGLALLFLDLDGFKPINDHFGHQLGDRVLQMVAERFANAIRAEDLLCRLGGDEFVVLVPQAGPVDALLTMAQKLVEVSRAPFQNLNDTISLSVSVGIARYPDHGDSCDQLLSAADNAMYAAKRSRTQPIRVANC